MVAGGPELLSLVEMIQRERDIDPEVVFSSLELAIETAIRKKYPDAELLQVLVDRGTGQISAYRDGVLINAAELGRIAAQTARQVITQKIREAEQDSIIQEYDARQGELVSGTIQRFERDDVIVQLPKGEGILPRSERVRGENPRVGDRIRATVLDVRRVGNRVRVVLSRTHPDLIRRLFELEVPEIMEGIIEIKHLSREPGYRTKLAVASYDPKIDCVGACVGVRGSRIRNVIDELGGEKIDIIRWNDSAEVLIMNALKPAEIESITLNEETDEAEVVVAEDQLSLAIGKKGQNVRLAAKLTGWDIKITSAEDAAGQAFQEAGLELDPEHGESPVAEPGVDTQDGPIAAMSPDHTDDQDGAPSPTAESDETAEVRASSEGGQTESAPTGLDEAVEPTHDDAEDPDLRG